MEGQMSLFEIGADKSNEVSEAALTNERTVILAIKIG